jgi:hypothetical protein
MKVKELIDKLYQRVEASAAQQYVIETANDPLIHCNRFPSWGELSDEHKEPYLTRALIGLFNEAMKVPL